MVKVALEPSKLLGNVGDRVSVTATVYGVTNLYAFEILLEYDPDILKCVDLSVGPFLTPSDPTKREVYQAIFDGRCQIGARLISPEEPKSGDGTLCFATFEVLKQGYTEIKLTSSLFDPDANAISHDSTGATFGQLIMQMVTSIISGFAAVLAVAMLVSAVKPMIKRT